MDKLLSQLNNHKEQIQAQLDAAKAAVKDHSAQLQKVRKAIAALTADDKPVRPAVTTKDVVEILEKRLKEGPLEIEKAKVFVAAELERQGIQKNGIGIRLKQAIAKFPSRDGKLFPRTDKEDSQ